MEPGKYVKMLRDANYPPPTPSPTGGKYRRLLTEEIERNIDDNRIDWEQKAQQIEAANKQNEVPASKTDWEEVARKAEGRAAPKDLFAGRPDILATLPKRQPRNLLAEESTRVARVQFPDGRIGRFKVPEGTTEDQVLEYARNMSKESLMQMTVGQTTPEQVSQALDRHSPQHMSDNTKLDAVTAASAPSAGITRGLQDFGEGIKQVGFEVGERFGIVESGTADTYTQQVDEGRRAYEETYGEYPSGDAMRVIASMAPYLLMPVKGAQTLTGRMAVTGAMGGAVSSTQFVPEGDSRTSNTATGAAVGAVIPPAIEGGGKIISKVVNALSGRLRPEAAELFNLGKQHNVPVYAPDVSKSATMRKTSVATEALPIVGMGGKRKAQNEAAQVAAENLKDRFAVAGDWTEKVQKGLQNKAKRVKAHAKNLYDQVGTLADPLGVQAPKVMNAKADQLLQRELAREDVYQDPALIRVLEKYSQDPKTDFSGLRDIRSELGYVIDDYYKGANAIVGKKGVGTIQQIKNSLELDLKRMANHSGGDLKGAWRSADKYYRENVVTFKDTALAKASNTDTPDEIYKTFIKTGKRDRAQKFYNALDKDGRSAVRYGMVEDAYQAATAEGRPFSPATFATRLEKNQEATGVFFKGNNKVLVNGFTKLMRHIERSGQYMENPPTGNRAIPWLLMGGATYMSPTATLSAASVSTALKGLFTTKAGRNLLFSASDLNIGGKAMDRLVNRTEQTMSRMIATQQGTDNNREETSIGDNKAAIWPGKPLDVTTQEAAKWPGAPVGGQP